MPSRPTIFYLRALRLLRFHFSIPLLHYDFSKFCWCKYVCFGRFAMHFVFHFRLVDLPFLGLAPFISSSQRVTRSFDILL
jgi:hypothetical protein